MKLTTSKGKSFDVSWVHAPVGPGGDMMLQMRDDRPLSEIAADFDGCMHFHRESDAQGNRDYCGYTELTAISRPFYATDRAVVGITMAMPEKA